MDYNMIVTNENDLQKNLCSRDIPEVVIFPINTDYFIHCIAQRT